MDKPQIIPKSVADMAKAIKEAHDDPNCGGIIITGNRRGGRRWALDLAMNTQDAENVNQLNPPDAFLCKKCGLPVERGIINIVEHADKCSGGISALEPLNDASFEIIEPKQLPDAEATNNEV